MRLLWGRVIQLQRFPLNASGFAQSSVRVWLAGLVLLIGSCPGAQAQFSSFPRSDFWVTDGPVYSILETNGVVYLGGDFSAISPNQSRTALLDTGTGLAVPTFPFVEGVVLAAVPDGEGGWYLGGRFSAVADDTRLNLARLRPDFTVDPSWNPGADDAVHALAVDGGIVFAGGEFSTIGGRARSRIAAIDASNGIVTDWDPNVCCDASPEVRSRVMALVARDGRVYAGGSFAFVNGQFRNNLALLNGASGEALPWPENAFNPDSFVTTLVLDSDLLYVGGRFQFMGNTSRANLAAVNALSGAANSWNPGANGDVQALVVSGDSVFAGGNFTAIAGQTRAHLAAIDVSTGLAREWDPSADGAVFRLAMSGTVVYAGGDFATVGGAARPGLAALNATLGTATYWNPAVASQPVQCLTINGSQLLASGRAVRGAKTRNGLAALDARTGRILDWNPNAEGAVFALAFADNTVYAGGDFLTVGGAPRTRVVAINAIDGSLLQWGTASSGPNGRVEALAVTTDTVYVAGGFTAVGTTFSPGIAAVNRLTGGAVPWRPIANRPVRAVMAFENAVYAVGSFSSIGTQPRNCFASLDTVTAGALEWNPNALGAGVTGWTIARSGNLIYAGGSFTDIGGQARLHLAALDLATGQATDWNPGLSSLNDSVRRVSVAGDAVYVAGTFSFIGGQPRRDLAALDTVTGEALGWNPDPASRSGGLAVSVVEASGGAVYIGGSFDSLGGRRHPYFAAFAPIGAPRITRQPIHTLAFAGQPTTLSVEIAGQEPLFVQWQVNGTNLAGATDSNLIFNSPQAADAGDYSVIITNSLGYVSSVSAKLTVLSPLAITTQPADRSVAPGSFVSFSVVATGNPPLLYQWKLNGASIPGRTTATLSLTNVQPAASGLYSVVVYNGVESLESRAAVLTVSTPELPFADNFLSRFSTNSAAGAGMGSNTTATAEIALGEPDHAGKPGGHSVWYSWIAPATGVATFHTRGSDFDTLLAAYSFSSFGGLDTVASDDDSGGFQTSFISFNAVAGTRYEIAIDGYFGRTGRIVLTWSLQATADRLPRILLQPASQSAAPGANVTFTVVADSPTPLVYQWFHNGGPISGATNLFLMLGNLQPSNVGLYSVVVSNTTRAVESATASLEFGPVPEVVSQDKMEELFLGDAVGSRFIPLELGIDGGQTLNTIGAATQSGEPSPCGTSGGSSRWMRMRTSSVGTVVLDTVGSSIDTVLAVYTGTNMTNLASVACDNNSAPDGARSVVRFEAAPGTDYLVAVDGVNGAQGAIGLNWNFGIPPVVAVSPSAHHLRQGDSLTLAVTPVNAIPIPTCEWWLNGQIIPGATGVTLVLTNLHAGQSGTYSAVVRNALGAVTNRVALVAVAAPFWLNYTPVWNNGQQAVQIKGSITNVLVLEAAADLSTWVPLHTVTAIVPIDFVDPASGGFPRRFYRGVLAPATGMRYSWATNGGRRAFRLSGPINQSLILEATTNLEAWLPVRTNSVVVPFDFIDLESTNAPARFYRLVPCD